MKRMHLPVFAACLLLVACTKSFDNEKEVVSLTSAQAKKAKTDNIIHDITFTEENLFPEGVVYDRFNDRFYVSSTTRGDIGIVTGDGHYSAFITDPALTSTTGLEIDNARKLLYVSNATAGAVGVYSTNTGERIHYIDLRSLLPGAPVFLNDIALDPQGNAYVTNSLTPVIYKITPDGTATIFYQDPAFATTPGGFGFNGIEYSNTGYLLVAFSFGNQIIKFPIADPSGYSIVQLDAALAGPDGLLLSKDNKQLIVVNNAGGANGRVISFISDNKWKSGTAGTTFQTGSVFPTTATSNGKDIFVLYAYLNRRQAGQADFTIKHIPITDTRPF